MYGYVELVGNRERGEGELIDGPRDRESREDAQKMFAQHEENDEAREACPADQAGLITRPPGSDGDSIDNGDNDGEAPNDVGRVGIVLLHKGDVHDSRLAPFVPTGVYSGVGVTRSCAVGFVTRSEVFQDRGVVGLLVAPLRTSCSHQEGRCRGLVRCRPEHGRRCRSQWL